MPARESDADIAATATLRSKVICFDMALSFCRPLVLSPVSQRLALKTVTPLFLQQFRATQ
jgi:hypothetical protein